MSVASYVNIDERNEEESKFIDLVESQNDLNTLFKQASRISIREAKNKMRGLLMEL